MMATITLYCMHTVVILQLLRQHYQKSEFVTGTTDRFVHTDGPTQTFQNISQITTI